MLASIAAKNFKAFGENPGLDLSLSRLNLFLGQNNSGKTSAIDVLAVLAQTARATSGVMGLRWSGELIDLGPTGEYALHNGVTNSILQVEAQIPAPANFLESISQQLGLTTGLTLDIATIGYRLLIGPGASTYKYEFLTNGHVLVRNLIRPVADRGNQAVLEIRGSENLGVSPVMPAASGGSIFNPTLFVAQNLDRNNPAHGLPLASLLMSQLGIEAVQQFLSSRVFLVSASRGIQQRRLDDKFEIPDVGRNGQHTLQVLSAVFAKPQYRSAAAKIREWGQVFGLCDVSSGWAGGRELTSGYTDPLSATPLPLHSAGFGSQQILPVIVQLFASPTDSLVVIEEPEICLHPAAQVDLVRMFVDAVRAGRQVVVTTHSQYLVMALQEQVKRNITAGDISVYHFSRDRNDSLAEKLPLDVDGVLRGWIPSFAKVERELLSSWMSRVHDKLKED